MAKLKNTKDEHIRYSTSFDGKNTYNMEGIFSIVDNLLITTYASIPLENISKLWIRDISPIHRLSGWCWFFAILCIAGAVASIEYSPIASVILGIIAAIILICSLKKKKKKNYAFYIESNSGSVEIFHSPNVNVLVAAMNYVEAGIKSLRRGTILAGTFNINSGLTSDIVIIHGDSNNAANSGSANNQFYSM